MLDVVGVDSKRSTYDAIEGIRMHGRDDGLRKTESRDAIYMVKEKDDNFKLSACKEIWFICERRPKNCDRKPVVKHPVELQHPSDLSKLEDDLKRLEKPGLMIQCVTEEPDEYIVSDTEEFLFENCLKDVKEDKACIPLKKFSPVVVVFESVPKEVKTRVHEKRCPMIKENKDYYFIPKRRQTIENSIAYCNHRVLVNHKRRKKEDVPLKTCHIDHLGPHRITEIDEGVMEQTVRFEQDLQ
ncbi:hypothetical protein TNCV_256011 [Trichonephila clavipes]|nr:hypothetical protein TNCV_256011 [Trichonephila clavipes]